MVSTDRTPLASTRSKLSRSLNMMSNVNSNGPAFLLRMSFVNCHSSAISLLSLTGRRHSRYKSALQIEERHLERHTRIVQSPYVVGTELIYGAGVDPAR